MESNGGTDEFVDPTMEVDAADTGTIDEDELLEEDDNTTVTIRKVIWPSNLAGPRNESAVQNPDSKSDDNGHVESGAATIPEPNDDTAETQGKKKKKNLSGAERKRRRKARAEMANLDPNQPENSTARQSTNKKRGRSPNASGTQYPPSKKALEKTPPVNQRTATFKEVVQDSMTYYVVGADLALTADQVGAVMGNIIWELEKFIGSGIRAPSFLGKKTGESELELRCADSRTVEWLQSIVPKLKPWRKASLKVVTRIEWEAEHKPKRMIRMNVIVPWRATGSYFMDVLRSNNPDLRTKYWEIKNVQERDDSTRFHLKVDEMSVELLRARGYKAFWLLDEIEFRLDRSYGGAGGSDKQAETRTSTTAKATVTSRSTKTRNEPNVSMDSTGKNQVKEKADNVETGVKTRTANSTPSKNKVPIPAPSKGGLGGASPVTGTSNDPTGGSKEPNPVNCSTSM